MEENEGPSALDAALPLAVEMIAEFEGFRASPYRDNGKGIWTIGYGFTWLPSGKPVEETTPEMSEADAKIWLNQLVKRTMAAVRGMVYRDITDAQVAALTSFAYNEGTSALRGSSLLVALNQGRIAEAANDMLAWVYAGDKVDKGLVNRRKREREVFLGSSGAQMATRTLESPGELQADALMTKYNS